MRQRLWELLIGTKIYMAHMRINYSSVRTHVKRTYVARKSGVDGLEGRHQAHRDVFTASAGTSCVSPVMSNLILLKTKHLTPYSLEQGVSELECYGSQ